MSSYLGNKLISGAEQFVGESRNIGQIIPSAIPLTDAGLHLLDGTLINGSGIYSAFVDYIAGFVTNYPDLFETEANWQTAVTTYGVCGKFVYNSENNTLRLPKITGIIEGTTDLTALGDLIEAGLPNITGSCTPWGYQTLLTPSGAFGQSGTNKHAYNSSDNNAGSALDFDASRSSSIYGNSSTVQPQTIKVLYYIVIATTTKTEIQVDIDEVTTDLNGKCDTDLSNMAASASAKNTIVTWGMPDYSAGVSVSSYTSSSNQFTAPCDGIINWGANRANGTKAYVNNLRWNSNYGANATLYSNCTIPLNKGDKFYATAYADNGDLCNIFFPMKGAS